VSRRIGQSMLAPPPRRSGPWASRVIDELCDLKAAGLDFETAWAYALSQHPPRGRDVGEQRPELFADGAEGELSPVEFLKVSASDAWHGRRPVLKQLVVQEHDRGETVQRVVA
jgi:hypothetical protein